MEGSDTLHIQKVSIYKGNINWIYVVTADGEKGWVKIPSGYEMDWEFHENNNEMNQEEMDSELVSEDMESMNDSYNDAYLIDQYNELILGWWYCVDDDVSFEFLSDGTVDIYSNLDDNEWILPESDPPESEDGEFLSEDEVGSGFTGIGYDMFDWTNPNERIPKEEMAKVIIDVWREYGVVLAVVNGVSAVVGTILMIYVTKSKKIYHWISVYDFINLFYSI